ncbi:GNAT family N-acetyltransferase [Saccharopolyspora spinosporotrichia]
MVAPVGFARYRQPCADPIVCWSAPAIATLRPWLVNRCHCRGSTATRCRCGEWRESDIPRLVEAFNDPVIVGTLLDPVLPFTEEHARARLERFETARRDRAGVTAAVVTDGPAIGLLGLTGLDWQHESGTLGYWMHADGRGRGLAAAGVNLFVAWAFETLGPARVELTTSFQHGVPEPRRAVRLRLRGPPALAPARDGRPAGLDALQPAARRPGTGGRVRMSRDGMCRSRPVRRHCVAAAGRGG